ncbi:MAG TPA: hypothetical protein VK053_11650, partial [Jiangellaceae bacterium]|nr:hypothetical protein [Jiangellaceae bacterium]
MAEDLTTAEGGVVRPLGEVARDAGAPHSTDGAPGQGIPGAGSLLRLLRDGVPRTRSEIAGITGLARSTVAQRVDALLTSELIGPVSDGASTGGRPPARFA